ncbi:hypothetical protein ACOMHN_019693 [Nucella lapillus]
MGFAMVCFKKPKTQDELTVAGSEPAGEISFKRADSNAKFGSHIYQSIFGRPDFNPLTYTPKKLTEQEKATIRKSWDALNNIPDPVKTVVTAFVRMFVLAPESTRLFQWMKDSKDNKAGMDDEVLKSAVMRKHLHNVLEFLAGIIHDLDHLDVPGHMKSKELEGKQVWYGARVEFIKALCDGFLFAFEKTLWPDVDAETLKAWEALFLLIAHDWANGIQAEFADVQAKGKPLPGDLPPFTECPHGLMASYCETCQKQAAAAAATAAAAEADLAASTLASARAAGSSTE